MRDLQDILLELRAEEALRQARITLSDTVDVERAFRQHEAERLGQAILALQGTLPQPEEAVESDAPVDLEPEPALAPSDEPFPKLMKKLHPRARDEIVRISRSPAGLTRIDLMDATGLSLSQAEGQIAFAEKKGIIVREGTRKTRGGAGRPAKRWAYVQPTGSRTFRSTGGSEDRRSGGAAVAGTGKGTRPSRSETRDLVDAAKAAGGKVEPTKNGHIKITGPNGIAIISSTPSDHRTIKNERAAVRQAGIAV